MKIAVTAQGTDLTSQVDPRFGRAKTFLVIDTETQDYTSHDNTQNLNAPQGAGIQAGRAVVDLGVEVVLTGNVGPKAFATLQAGGVKVCPGASGTVQDALEQFKAGRFEEARDANVPGHWS